MQESPQKPSENTTAEILRWIFTIIAVVMFARLVLVIIRFSGMALGWLQDGSILERSSDLNPTKVMINIAIFVIVIGLLIYSRVSKKKDG